MCGLKLVESQLLASLAAANTRSDAATLRAQRLAAALEVAATRMADAGALDGEAAAGDAHQQGGAQLESAGSLAAQVAQLQCQLLAKSQEAYGLQDRLMQAAQQAAVHELAISELRAQLGDSSQASAAQQAADAAALSAQRSALMAAAAAQEARLRRELQEVRQLLQEQSSESSAAMDALRAATEAQAHEAAATSAETAQSAAAAALHAAEVRTALLEGQLDASEAERSELQAQVCVGGVHVGACGASGLYCLRTYVSCSNTVCCTKHAPTHTPRAPRTRTGGPPAGAG